MPQITAALAGRRVLLSGHTGFKGAWLSLWLKRLGAEVYGLALEPPTSPSMFALCDLDRHVDHEVIDIRNYEAVRARVAAVRPSVVFHLAAQPLVRRSYLDPLETVATNVMGTAHILEAVRAEAQPCAIVVISSDKCYDNRDWVWGYRENDPLGGDDPYSASKGSTELVAASWRKSFFGAESPIAMATARAGNVIGGGDWAADRIVTDCVRSFIQGERVELRNPNATRPWQHVLEPLSGYLLLAARLLGPDADSYCSAWNFGPRAQDVQSVATLVDRLARSWGETTEWGLSEGPHPHEARSLALNCDKAQAELGWFPTWSLQTAADRTASWYRAWHRGATDMLEFSQAQIADFENAMSTLN